MRRLAVGLALLVGCKDEPLVAHHDLTKKTAAPVEAPATRAAAAPQKPAPAECDGVVGAQWDCPTPEGNPMPLATFKATSVDKPTVFKVSGRLSDYYNYEFNRAQKTHYSIEIREEAKHISGRVHAYLPRADPAAEALFDLVKDAEPHTMRVELVYAKNSRDNGVVKMVRFVGAGWED